MDCPVVTFAEFPSCPIAIICVVTTNLHARIKAILEANGEDAGDGWCQHPDTILH